MADPQNNRLSRYVPDSLHPAARRAMAKWRSTQARFRAFAAFGPRSFVTPSPNVAREIAAVRSGQQAFKETEGAQNSTDYTLRRNTHRLEKGLISRPRRDTFATSYIQETVAHYAAAQQHGPAGDNHEEVVWSHDVLVEYFASVGSSPEIDRARLTFLALDDPTPIVGDSLIPYRRDLNDRLTPSYEQFLDLSVRRRSVRWFEDRDVPRELIDAAIAAAAQAPSACNRQPFEYFIYDTPRDVARIAAIPPGTVGFADNFPVIVALIGRLDAFFSDRDRHLIYIDGSLSAMAFMLALETVGLSSCPINTPGDEAMERKMADELGLTPHERPIMFIAVGYPDPDGLVPRSHKKNLDSLRRYNP